MLDDEEKHWRRIPQFDASGDKVAQPVGGLKLKEAAKV